MRPHDVNKPGSRGTLEVVLILNVTFSLLNPKLIVDISMAAKYGFVNYGFVFRLQAVIAHHVFCLVNDPNERAK